MQKRARLQKNYAPGKSRRGGAALRQGGNPMDFGRHPNMHRPTALPGLLAAVLTAGCAFMSNAREEALHLARAQGFHPWHADAGGFRVSGQLHPPDGETEHLIVYIEGDGFAWVNRATPSSDPTPHDPIALRMAAADPSPAVLYLARPCQYEGRDSPLCDTRHWTSHRYSEELVQVMDTAIDQARQETGASHIGLVGYSGGGVIAALLAARRTDVDWWMTVAANLDLEAWLRHHDVSPMPDSLNPVDYTDLLANTYQVHLSGQEDEDVPPKVLLAYRQRFPNPDAIPARIVPTFDHTCCWGEEWPELLNETIPWRKHR